MTPDASAHAVAAHSLPTPPAPVVAAPTRRQDTAALGDAIAELSSRIQAATYELLVLIRRFDERGGWGEGFRSCAHWLNWRTGLDLGAAREKVRVAKALGALPRLGAEMRRGALSYSKARALTRIATPQNEARLVDLARAATAAHVERVVRAWRRADRLADADDDRRQHAGRQLDAWFDDDGMLVVRGRLTPEAGALLLRALEAAEGRLYHEERETRSEERVHGTNLVPAADSTRARSQPQVPNAAEPEASASQRRADALALIAESALTTTLDRGTTGDRHQVVLHVDAEALRDSATTGADSGAGGGQAVLDDGIRVSAETSRRMACDAGRVVVRQDRAGAALDVGRKRRTIPPAIRRALDARDRHCRFPGCGCRHTDAHHIRHWATGGATRLDNLVLLCRRHHRAVHEEGFSLELAQDGAVRFRGPDGRPLPEARHRHPGPAARWVQSTPGSRPPAFTSTRTPRHRTGTESRSIFLGPSRCCGGRTRARPRVPPGRPPSPTAPACPGKQRFVSRATAGTEGPPYRRPTEAC